MRRARKALLFTVAGLSSALFACGGGDSGGASVDAAVEVFDAANETDGGREWTTPVPTSELTDYFADRGIEYAGPYSLSGGGEDYLYVPFRDPGDDETMIAYFEIDTGTAMNTAAMHFAASLRGPDPERTIPHYGGRGIAFGHLSYFDHCSDVGYFLEDFARNALAMPEMQMTYCAGHPFLANTTYRFDMRVSKNDTYIGIWRVTAPDRYELELEVACTTAAGPYRDVGPCPEHVSDEPYGGFFVGSGFADPDDVWSVADVYVGIVPDATL